MTQLRDRLAGSRFDIVNEGFGRTLPSVGQVEPEKTS